MKQTNRKNTEKKRYFWNPLVDKLWDVKKNHSDGIKSKSSDYDKMQEKLLAR